MNSTLLYILILHNGYRRFRVTTIPIWKHPQHTWAAHTYALCCYCYALGLFERPTDQRYKIHPSSQAVSSPAQQPHWLLLILTLAFTLNKIWNLPCFPIESHVFFGPGFAHPHTNTHIDVCIYVFISYGTAPFSYPTDHLREYLNNNNFNKIVFPKQKISFIWTTCFVLR